MQFAYVSELWNNLLHYYVTNVNLHVYLYFSKIYAIYAYDM